ncbi:hypothetical protein D3C84_1150460 [compost metagenome]
MHHPGIWHEQHAPAGLMEAHAPVQVLAMKEIVFVPQPDTLDRFAFDQHASPGDGLNDNGGAG